MANVNKIRSLSEEFIKSRFHLTQLACLTLVAYGNAGNLFMWLKSTEVFVEAQKRKTEHVVLLYWSRKCNLSWKTCAFFKQDHVTLSKKLSRKIAPVTVL